MEKFIEKMQDENAGVPVRTVKSFLSKIPSVFTGNNTLDFESYVHATICT